MPGHTLLTDRCNSLQLDDWLADHNAALPPLKPSSSCRRGSRAASLAHVCRTVSRAVPNGRLSRWVTARDYQRRAAPVPEPAFSDLLFVLARVLNRVDGGDDVYWKSERMARAAAAEAEDNNDTTKETP
jgi:cob(I)alamin adenosyltransferase